MNINHLSTLGRKILLSLTILVSALSATAAEPSVKAVADLLDRIGGPGTSDRIVTRLEPGMAGTGGADRYTITSENGKPCIKGSSISAITAGLGYYLNHHANVNLAWNRLTTDLSGTPLPVPAADETRTSRADYRYYLNYCTFSYSMSTWTWDRWQQEIDWMALHGINLPLQIIGLDVVWKRLLTERYGYTPAQADAFVAGPCFQAWWGMNNLEGWGGPNPEWWYERQSDLARKIGDRQRELGIHPVLPGYAGMVPSNFTSITGLPSTTQGNWCAFRRPYILNPNNEAFKQVAKDYYEILTEVMGSSDYYSMDPFHEGANTSGIDVPAAYSSLWTAMHDAAPDAHWVIQRWQWSADQHNVLDKVPKGRLIILDLFSDAHTHFQDYKGHESVWCMLPNFGARTGTMGRFNGVIEGYFDCVAKYGNITGIGATPEGIEQTPVLYDMLFELPWLESRPDPAEWMASYTRSRYGTDNEMAAQAWELLRKSALDCRTGLQGPHEAVICARPSLTVDRVSSWGGSDIFYDRADLIRAAMLLLDSGLDGDNYSYDLTDICRQALTDYSKTLLAALAEANTAGDTDMFNQRRDALLGLILDIDRLLNTNPTFMLGHWTELARAIADERPGTTDADRDWLELDNARTLITTWGAQANAEAGGLRDYSYREWGGMLKDFYYARWKTWFDNGMKAPAEGWFAWEKAWAHDNSRRYPVEPVGNTADVARELFSHYLIPVSVAGQTAPSFIDRHAATRLNLTDVAIRGTQYRPALAWAEGDEPEIIAMHLDLNGDGKFATSETLEAPFVIPGDMPLTGRRALRVTYGDGTVVTLEIMATEQITAPRTVAVRADDPAHGTVAIQGSDLTEVTNDTPVTVIATPAPGYQFSYWADSRNQAVSTENPMTYYGAEPEVFTAVFVLNVWSVPQCDWGNDRQTMIDYGQYLSRLYVRQGNTNRDIHTAETFPDQHFILTDPVDAAPGASLLFGWAQPGSGLQYMFMTAYADLNNDGTFDPATELIAKAGTHGATDASVASAKPRVNIPFDAPAGLTHIRLRFDGAWYNTGWDPTYGCFGADGPTNRIVYEIPLRIGTVPPHDCKVTVKSSDPSAGSVDINATTFAPGEVVVIRAFPADGYRLRRFVDSYKRELPAKWIDGNTLSFPVYDNATITVEFEPASGVVAVSDDLPFSVEADHLSITVTFGKVFSPVSVYSPLGALIAVADTPTSGLAATLRLPSAGPYLICAAGHTARITV